MAVVRDITEAEYQQLQITPPKMSYDIRAASAGESINMVAGRSGIRYAVTGLQITSGVNNKFTIRSDGADIHGGIDTLAFLGVDATSQAGSYMAVTNEGAALRVHVTAAGNVGITVHYKELGPNV